MQKLGLKSIFMMKVCNHAALEFRVDSRIYHEMTRSSFASFHGDTEEIARPDFCYFYNDNDLEPVG